MKMMDQDSSTVSQYGPIIVPPDVAVHVWLLLCAMLITDGATITEDLDSVTAEVVFLERKYDQLNNIYNTHQGYADHLYNTVMTLQGASCGDLWLEYRCRQKGLLTTICLPSYLVCDGVADCPDGDDESRCDTIFDYIHVGMKFGCLTLFDHCSPFGLVSSDLDCVIETISDVTISKTRHAHLTCLYLFEEGYTTRGDFYGTWIPGSNSIAWISPLSPNLLITWRFNPMSKGVASGEIHRTLTKMLCSRNVIFAT